MLEDQLNHYINFHFESIFETLTMKWINQLLTTEVKTEILFVP